MLEPCDGLWQYRKNGKVRQEAAMNDGNTVYCRMCSV